MCPTYVKTLHLNTELNHVSKMTVHVFNICKNMSFKYRITFSKIA